MTQQCLMPVQQPCLLLDTGEAKDEAANPKVRANAVKTPTKMRLRMGMIP